MLSVSALVGLLTLDVYVRYFFPSFFLAVVTMCLSNIFVITLKPRENDQ